MEAGFYVAVGFLVAWMVASVWRKR